MHEIQNRLENNPNERNLNDMGPATRVGSALSLAGGIDLSLVGEVARMEASITRHVLQLRKLVLRYSKALIIFVWTALALTAVSAILSLDQLPEPELPRPLNVEQRKIVAVLITYALWSLGAIILVRRPVYWINRLVFRSDKDEEEAKEKHADSGRRRRKRGKVFRDPDLAKFEVVVTIMFVICFFLCCWLAYTVYLVASNA